MKSFYPVKNYILDTNVVLHDPNALLNFADNNVLIPIEAGERQDSRFREFFADDSGGRDAVHFRHAEIQQRDVGAVKAEKLHRLTAIRRLRDQSSRRST